MSWSVFLSIAMSMSFSTNAMESGGGEGLGIGDGGRGCQRRDSGGFQEFRRGGCRGGCHGHPPGENENRYCDQGKQDFDKRPERKERYDHILVESSHAISKKMQMWPNSPFFSNPFICICVHDGTQSFWFRPGSNTYNGFLFTSGLVFSYQVWFTLRPLCVFYDTISKFSALSIIDTQNYTSCTCVHTCMHMYTWISNHT